MRLSFKCEKLSNFFQDNSSSGTIQKRSQPQCSRILPISVCEGMPKSGFYEVTGGLMEGYSHH